MTKENKWGIVSALAFIGLCGFEAPTLIRYISYVAEGKTSYAGSLAIELIFVCSLILSGIFIMLGKRISAAISLSVSAAVSLYQTASYLISIADNEKNFGIVCGNVFSILEIALFAIPLITVLLPAKAKTNKLKAGVLISESVLFLLSFGSRIAEFSAWGKSFFLYFTLFFEVYGIEIFRCFVAFLAFSLAAVSVFPKSKKR